MARWIHLLIFCTILVKSLCGQTNSLVGNVIDEEQHPLIGASLSWRSNPTHGTFTDTLGRFDLEILKLPDTLVVSFIGYNTLYIPIMELNLDKIQITLEEATNILDPVTLLVSKSFASEYSIVTLDKIDVYLNPLSSGDALRAITLLPSSTNTNESANPELRGSPTEFSSVQINGIPLRNPIKSGALDGVGFFSLINTETLKELSVFASNPPIYAGQTIGGLVEIQTEDRVQPSSNKLALSLANYGFIVTRPFIQNKVSIQVFGNYQDDHLFRKLNGSRLNFINDFYNLDFGANMTFRLKENSKLKILSYFLDEENNVDVGVFNYFGQSLNEQKRSYHILQYVLQKERSALEISAGHDWNTTSNTFGAISSSNTSNGIYFRGNLKKFFNADSSINFGADIRFETLSGRRQFPVFFSLIGTTDSTLITSIGYNNNIYDQQFFGYYKKKLNEWVFSGGLRYGFVSSERNIDDFLGGQVNIKYNVNAESKVILGLGQYNKVILQENETGANSNSLSSRQISLDYIAQRDNFSFQASMYWRDESYSLPTFDVFEDGISNLGQEVIGFELSSSLKLLDNIDASLSYTFIRSLDPSGTKLNPSLDYFIKSTLSYPHPKIGTISMNYQLRPGNLYTEVTGSSFEEDFDEYIPVFDNRFNDQRFPVYSNLSITYSKLLPVGSKKGLILFASANNLLNRENVSSIYFNQDYSGQINYNFQPLVFYIGCQFEL